MQIRDEELYWAYQDIDNLEIKVLRQRKTILILSFSLGIIILIIGISVFLKIKTGAIIKRA